MPAPEWYKIQFCREGGAMMMEASALATSRDEAFDMIVEDLELDLEVWKVFEIRKEGELEEEEEVENDDFEMG